ncbi:protein translocase subunit SecD, partial [Mycobacterium sp. SMC-4]
MASSSAPVQPVRYLALFLVLLIGAYLLVFLTGDKKAEPKLGIDLQGGTRVTLTARTPDGTPPTRESLNQAQQIISARVDGLGVSGSEVIIDGDNLVITVPGNDGTEARSLGQTARLYIRPVIHAIPSEAAMPPEEAGPQGAPPPGGVPGMPPGAPGAPPAGAVPPGVAPLPPGALPGAPEGAAPGEAPAPQPRPFPQQPAPTPDPSPSPAPGP